MATIDDRAFIDRIIAGNGRIDQEEAPDNPWVSKIIEYTNLEGRRTWAVVFETESPERQLRYEIETPYVRAPRVIWRRVAVAVN